MKKAQGETAQSGQNDQEGAEDDQGREMQDVKAYLSQLIRKAEAGETVILTGHGEPTVRLLVELQGEEEPLRTRH